LYLDPAVLYHEAQKVDEWPGEDYDGTSVRALFKVLKTRGYVEEYRWAFDAKTVIDHVLARGPVVLGTTWTRDMFMPDSKGYIYFTGPIEGGHAYTVIGCQLEHACPDGSIGRARIINSWGRGWGPHNGRAWITMKTLQALIEDYGEACVSTEKMLAA
jgi:hypothetical protein